MEKHNSQEGTDRDQAGGIASVNGDKYTGDADRDALIPNEEDTARVRSEAQSVRDASAPGAEGKD